MRNDGPMVECNICSGQQFVVNEIVKAQYKLGKYKNHINRHIAAITAPRVGYKNLIARTLGDKIEIIGMFMERNNWKGYRIRGIDDCEKCFEEAEARRSVGYWSRYHSEESNRWEKKYAEYKRHYDAHLLYEEMGGEYR